MKEDYDISCYELDSIVGVSGLTVGQMVTMYRDASKKGKQLRALCELSGWDEKKIKALLLAHGVSPMEMPRERKNAAEPEPTETCAEDLPLPADAKDAFSRATAAINDLAEIFDKYIEALASALRKLERIKELLDREGVFRNES